MGIFKACDIRGIYGKDLTEREAYAIGRAVGTRLVRKTVVVGGDLRPSTLPLKESLIQGLIHTGAEVVDIGMVPTPAFYFALRHWKIYGGVMVTASHNPAEFNGFKIVLEALPVTPEDLKDIQIIIQEGKYLSGAGKVISRPIIRKYQQFISSFFSPPPRSQKVVIDAGSGSLSLIAPALFESLNYQVVKLYCEPDGTFPYRHPNPAIKENLKDLVQKVKETSANIGIAYDGDGDRVIFVDDEGEVVSGDKAIIILVRELLASKPGGKVVYDIKCSTIVPETIRQDGGIPIVERSGHAFIKRRVILEGAVFGGEISGHFFYDLLEGGDDALYSSLLMGKIVTDRMQKLSQMVKAIPTYYITPDIRIPYGNLSPEEILSAIREGARGEQISELDGIRVQYSEGWALARISVTEPLLTFRFEARNREKLPEIINRFLSAVPDIRQQVFFQLSIMEK